MQEKQEVKKPVWYKLKMSDAEFRVRLTSSSKLKLNLAVALGAPLDPFWFIQKTASEGLEAIGKAGLLQVLAC